jgi:type I restriction enzyme, S subunit
MTAWPAVPLQDLCSRITVGHVGPMADQYVDDGVPFLRSQNVRPFQISTEHLKFIPPEFHQQLRKSALSRGDVVVVRTGYPGTAAVIPESMDAANCADLVVITPGPELDPYFLCALFNSTWGIASVAGRLVGSAQQHFNIGAARQLEVHLPPIQTQQKVASILSAYDELIENSSRRIAVLEEMSQRIYREWFVDFRYPGHAGVPVVDSALGPLPHGWLISRLGEVCERITDGAHSSPPSTIGGLPMASVKDMTPRRIDLTGCRKISREAFDALERQNCRPSVGDVLIAKDGSYLKHVFTVETEPPYVLLSSIAILRPNELIRPAFLAMFLRQPEVKARLGGYVSGAALPRIVLKDFRSFPIVVPPAQLLTQFDEVTRPMWLEALLAEELCDRLRATRGLLLPRLVSGQVEVDDLDITVDEAAA